MGSACPSARISSRSPIAARITPHRPAQPCPGDSHFDGAERDAVALPEPMVERRWCIRVSEIVHTTVTPVTVTWTWPGETCLGERAPEVVGDRRLRAEPLGPRVDLVAARLAEHQRGEDRRVRARGVPRLLLER